MDIAAIIDLLNSGGVLAILVLIVVGGWRRWYVWSWQYREVVTDRDFWRSMALRGTTLAERVTDAAGKSDG